MGRLIYGPAAREMDIEDRALAHLQIVVVAKLRRGESFAFTWQREPEDSGSQHVIWIHPAIFLEFVFTEGGRGPLNRVWIDELMAKANSITGLELFPEPEPAETPTSARGRVAAMS